MNLLKDYIERIDFTDFNDFHNNFKYKEIDSFNFGTDIVDKYALLEPDKKALVWCNKDGEEHIFSFKDIKDKSNQVANMLIKKGIKKGDAVMSMLNRRFEYYLLNVACCKIGAIIIPATYLLTAKDIAYRCNAANVKMVISINEKEVISNIVEAMQGSPTVNTYYTLGQNEHFENFDNYKKESVDLLINEKPSINDIMMIYFTSGTTGYPKMVEHNFKYPLGHIMTAKYWQDVIDDGLHFTMAETGWAKFSWGKLYGQWISGTAVFCYDYYGRFTPLDVLPLISKYKITTFCAPPTIYRFLIKENMKQYDFSSIVRCTTAGEPLNAEVSKQFKKITGLQIFEGFGQTESAVILSTNKYIDAHPGSMGKPSPIFDIVLIMNNEIVSDGEEGEICIKLRKNQYGLLAGYYNDEYRTQKAFFKGFYHKGDLANKDREGYFWFVGRKDDIIKSSGYRIGPFEVESALIEHPSVLECAITAAPDTLRGQVVKATIVLAKGYSPSEELKKEIQDYVKKATAPYKYPRIIDFVKELPKTISGKIKHKDIRNKDNG